MQSISRCRPSQFIIIIRNRTAHSAHHKWITWIWTFSFSSQFQRNNRQELFHILGRCCGQNSSLPEMKSIPPKKMVKQNNNNLDRRYAFPFIWQQSASCAKLTSSHHFISRFVGNSHQDSDFIDFILNNFLHSNILTCCKSWIYVILIIVHTDTAFFFFDDKSSLQLRCEIGKRFKFQWNNHHNFAETCIAMHSPGSRELCRRKAIKSAYSYALYFCGWNHSRATKWLCEAKDVQSSKDIERYSFLWHTFVRVEAFLVSATLSSSLRRC